MRCDALNLPCLGVTVRADHSYLFPSTRGKNDVARFLADNVERKDALKTSMTAREAAAICRVGVGSKNPVKVNAVKEAFLTSQKDLLDDSTRFEWFSYDVPSGVSDQPMTEEETRKGAHQRANRVIEAHEQVHAGMALHFAVGVEGGCALMAAGERTPDVQEKLSCYAWMTIVRVSDKRKSDSRTATFFLPPAIKDLMQREGLELGAADDIVFKQRDTKKGSG